MLLLGALLSSAWDAYVLLFGAAVRLAVFLSLLVSADRILAIAKYLFVKARQRLTGRAPEDDWGYAPLPEDLDNYPMVRAEGCSAGGRLGRRRLQRAARAAAV